ncbi:MAG: general stress protein [Dehalococcoidia bacterium]|nr:general stress protein [Chloroflexota bacterium]MCK4242459.1 general stress protein [Dehalococcoidia bacterium]
MAKAAVKLFKDPINAEKAAAELEAKGFKADEIGILVHDKKKAVKFTGTKTVEVTLPEAGSAVALGAMATALGKADNSEEAMAALTDVLGLPEETVRYYDFGLAVGGILISVHTDEARLAQAQEILRSADVLVTAAKGEMWGSSPGFGSAGRMTETDPIDAKMTGDFRRY